MSDENNDELDLILDLDDDWEQEPTNRVNPESQRPAEAPSAPRIPPAPSDLDSRPERPTEASPPDILDLIPEEDEDEDTRIAAIPVELFESLQALERPQGDRGGRTSVSTKPPPPAEPPEASGFFSPLHVAHHARQDADAFDDEHTQVHEPSLGTRPPRAPSDASEFDDDERGETHLHQAGGRPPVPDHAAHEAHTARPPPGAQSLLTDLPSPTLAPEDERRTQPQPPKDARPTRPHAPKPIATLQPFADDEPIVEIGETDDLEWSDLTDLDDFSDLAPPSEDDAPAPPLPSLPPTLVPAPPTAARADRMADAARRTVKRRRPRAEQLPLVGEGPDVDAARRELLIALARASEGETRGALYVQAAELAERGGDAFAARELYDEARSADPRSAEALRGLQRLDSREEDWAGAYELLMQEASLLPLPNPVRAEAATAAALVAWYPLQDPERAREAALSARRLDREDVLSNVLLARIALADDRDEDGRAALTLADGLSDGPLRASLRLEAGRRSEARGQHAEALGLYEHALEDDPGAVDARWGVARTALASTQPERALAALEGLVDFVGERSRAHAPLKRAAGRIEAALQGQPQAAAARLHDAADAVSLRARARWAQRRGDGGEALTAWADGTSGVERALACLELAEWQSDRGERDAAEASLARALDADGTLALTRVVREVLARRAGDTSRLADNLAGEQQDAAAALAAAARLAPDPDSLTAEREWLANVQGASDTQACASVLSLDAAAQAGDDEALQAALESLAQSGEAEARSATLLALADRAQDDPRGARKWLTRAREQRPDSALLIRALLRVTDESAERARLVQHEAETASGPRAASLHLARARELEGEARQSALEEAYSHSGSYAPARWAFGAAVRRTGDLQALYAVCLDEAGESEGPHRVAALVRAALIGAESDPDGTADLLVQAARQAPGDTILRVLVSRVGDALPAALRAEMFGHGAGAGDDPMARARLLTAAGACEDAGDHEEAVTAYERVLQDLPDDAVASAGVERLTPAREEVTRRREAQLERAQGTLQKTRAHHTLMQLASARGDADELAHARAVLTLEPRDPEALRALERAAMESGDPAALAEIEQRLLDTSGGGADQGARLRLISTCLQLGADRSDSALTPRFCALADQLVGGAWLARRTITAGLTAKEAECVATGFRLMLPSLVTATERASGLGRVLERDRSRQDALVESLEIALLAAPDHSTAHEALALHLERVERHEDAAERFEQAAKSALSAARQVRLWHRAAVLWQDMIEKPERARSALDTAARLDVSFRDVSARLEKLLGGREDLAGLIQLTEARLAAGGTPAQLASLHRNLADLHDRDGAHDQARENLRAALGFEPDDVPTLRQLAALSEREGDFREAAEGWIRVARLMKEPEQLAAVFFKLGQIYESQLPDPSRAEAAYRRVLKLMPTHVASLEALARLYEQQGEPAKKIEALTRLTQHYESPKDRRDAMLRLSKALERAERANEAERVLEALRKEQPTEPSALAALADLYRRQAAAAALAMHTNRSAGDLRRAIAQSAKSPSKWTALVEVLGWRGRPEPPRVVASVARALGVDAPAITRLAKQDGVLPGAGGAALSPELIDLLSPEGLTPALRLVLAEAADAFQRVMPFDPRAAGADKLPRRHPLRAQAYEIARWFGKSEGEIWVSEKVPGAFFSVADAEPTLLVGQKMVDALGYWEQRFLLARAYILAASHMSVVCRVSPEDLTLMMHALVHAFVEDHRPKHLDEATIVETSRRIQKGISRRAKEKLHAPVVEVGGAVHFDPTQLYPRCITFANRVALVATGAVGGALTSLCRMAGPLEGMPLRAEVVERTQDAKDLMIFAAGETHFEARRRAGADSG